MKPRQHTKYYIIDEQVQAIRNIQKTIHASCIEAGWYTNLVTGERIQRNFGEVLALMHSELSEALEGYRKDLKDSHLPHREMVEVELADVVIRLLDTAEAMCYDVGGAIQEKFAYNQSRADHKIENRKAPGGKKI